MTLGEFRELSKHLPDETKLIFIDDDCIYREVDEVWDMFAKRLEWNEEDAWKHHAVTREKPQNMDRWFKALVIS